MMNLSSKIWSCNAILKYNYKINGIKNQNSWSSVITLAYKIVIYITEIRKLMRSIKLIRRYNEKKTLIIPTENGSEKRKHFVEISRIYTMLLKSFPVRLDPYVQCNVRNRKTLDCGRAYTNSNSNRIKRKRNARGAMEAKWFLLFFFVFKNSRWRLLLRGGAPADAQYLRLCSYVYKTRRVFMLLPCAGKTVYRETCVYGRFYAFRLIRAD